MIESIKRFFMEKMDTSVQESLVSSERSVSIACCALLLEMAHADSEFSQSERDKIISILQTSFDMPQSDASELLNLSELERKESLDLWQFTNLINQTYSHEEKGLGRSNFTLKHGKIETFVELHAKPEEWHEIEQLD